MRFKEFGYADKLNSKIQQSVAYDNCIVIINDTEPEDRIEKIAKRLHKWAEKIGLEIGAIQADVEKILQYRLEEYMALDGEISTPKSSLRDFSRESMGGEN